MAAAIPDSGFATWISAKLQSLNVDDEVFGTYITSILDEEETSREEKTEAIAGILEEVEDESVEVICSDILDQWDQYQRETDKTNSLESTQSSKTEETMSSIMEKHATAVVKKELTKEQKEDKAAVLAMYAQISEDEDDDGLHEDGSAASGANTGFDIEKNTNVEYVAKLQKEQRDKARQDHEKKKEQDKEQRAKDKQKAVDRKEREKKRTQKQERRR